LHNNTGVNTIQITKQTYLTIFGLVSHFMAYFFFAGQVLFSIFSDLGWISGVSGLNTLFYLTFALFALGNALLIEGDWIKRLTIGVITFVMLILAQYLMQLV